MAKKRKLIAGASPIANLLPKEVIIRRAVAKTRKKSVNFVVASCFLVGAVSLVPFIMGYLKTLELKNIESETNQIILSQGEFSDITKMEAEIRNIETARQTVTANEVDWGNFITDLNSSLPTGVSINTLAMVQVEKPKPATSETADPTSEAVESAENSLDPSDAMAGGRPDSENVEVSNEPLITLQFSSEIVTDKLEKLDTWKNNLAKIQGFANVEFLSSSQNSDGFYSVIVNLYFTDELLWDRFLNKKDNGS